MWESESLLEAVSKQPVVNNSSRAKEHGSSRFLSETEASAAETVWGEVSLLCEGDRHCGDRAQQEHCTQRWEPAACCPAKSGGEINVPVDCVKCPVAGYDVKHSHVGSCYDQKWAFGPEQTINLDPQGKGMLQEEFY